MNRTQSSDYMEWAKTRSQAKYNLATSGMIAYPLADLPVSLSDIEMSGPSWYGYEPLQRALASKLGTGSECVVHATGTSMANHLAMAALLDAGDEVLIERPTYDPLLAVARYLGAEVRRFDRRLEEDFRVNVEEIERAVSPRTRLLVLTNLHNPTSAFIDEETLRRIGEIARSAGAKVLVDEVYLEAMFERSPGSAFHLGNQFVITSSLTKAYGLSGLRCGWVMAEPELAKKIWRLNDLFGNIPAHTAERLSVIALANIEKIAVRAKTLLETNRALLDSFLNSRDDLEAFRPEFGTVVFPRLKSGSVASLCALLREKYETTVVPGKFFEMEDHFRVGISCDTAILSEGLARLGAALDDIKEH